MGITYYNGIDFANLRHNVGTCFIAVDAAGQTVAPLLQLEPDTPIAGTSVDCPFGTAVGFEALLRGEGPDACEWDKGHKTRATEHWLRGTLWEYQSNQFWRQLSDTKPQHYVNKTGHVQSSLGLVIVPAFLNWCFADQQLNLADLVSARLGTSDLVESHPRPFLYSAIERIFNAIGVEGADWRSVLTNVVTYKDKKSESHLLQRRSTYEFLQQHSSHWLWDGYSLADSKDELLFVSDHTFDACLAALTAFAHGSQQTITWESAAKDVTEMSRKVVQTEGHISILSQRERTPPA